MYKQHHSVRMASTSGLVAMTSAFTRWRSPVQSWRGVLLFRTSSASRQRRPLGRLVILVDHCGVRLAICHFQHTFLGACTVASNPQDVCSKCGVCSVQCAVCNGCRHFEVLGSGNVGTAHGRRELRNIVGIRAAYGCREIGKSESQQ